MKRSKQLPAGEQTLSTSESLNDYLDRTSAAVQQILDDAVEAQRTVAKIVSDTSETLKKG